eukprot:4105697-Heterocapsa_arctica.AAC.1
MPELGNEGSSPQRKGEQATGRGGLSTTPDEGGLSSPDKTAKPTKVDEKAYNKYGEEKAYKKYVEWYDDAKENTK